MKLLIVKTDYYFFRETDMKSEETTRANETCFGLILLISISVSSHEMKRQKQSAREREEEEKHTQKCFLADPAAESSREQYHHLRLCRHGNRAQNNGRSSPFG